jgi:protein-disulfide isomerase
LPNRVCRRLEACVTGGDTRGELERDLALGDYVGIEGTPSVVVDNQELEAPSIEVLRQAIEAQQVPN